MSQSKIKKGIETAVIMLSLIVAFLVYRSIDPGKIIKPDSEPVTCAQIAAEPQKSYTGKTAGGDIPRLAGSSDFADIVGNTCVTAETQEIVATGIYSLNPWVDPYEITKMRNSRGRMVSTGRKAPEVTDSALQAVEYYQEYYLIRLEDGTYILAQFADSYRQKLEGKEAVTLPVGVKKTNTNAARQYLKEICEEYGADDTYTLYMIDDTWQEEHEFTFFLIKFGIAAVVFLILAVGLLIIIEKFEK